MNEGTEYYLQFKLFEHITKFKFVINEGINPRINTLRVHYFFSPNKHINDTLKDMLVDVRITDGDSWDKPIFSGKSMSLHDFTSDYCSFETILLPKIISLFSNDVKQHIPLQVYFFLYKMIFIDCSRINMRWRIGCENV